MNNVFALFICFVVAALAVFGMLRYSRKLHLLDIGARAASGGSYNAPIAVTGGELGSIAASINNISAGINAAVAERLRSERMKTELITNISHDIRTPITSLITYTDLLKSEGLNNERAPEYLEILIQKSARLKTLTDDLFEASKAASGNIDVCVANLDFVDLVRQVLGELDEKVRRSELDFRLNLPEHAPIRADGKLLWRVMENLLSNVFKYALPRSRVYIDIDPTTEDGWCRLDIKNISEHPLNVDPSELTERFMRGDEARGGEGSGLGLSIAQSFMLAQGGRFVLSIDGDLFKASLYLPKAVLYK
jgi:signal transduction histidine kinase